MTVGWKDIEDAEIISNWRKEKMEIVVNGINRRVLCTIINALNSASHEPRSEKFDTKFIPGKGWVPPLEIWRKEGERARKRTENEIIDKYDDQRGHTLKERREFRHECSKASKQLGDLLKVCPREMCPIEHCSHHC